MNVWILSGWNIFDGEWVNLAVLFNSDAVLPKVNELLTECTQFNQIKVETWYRENEDDDASYYEEETFYAEGDD